MFKSCSEPPRRSKISSSTHLFFNLKPCISVDGPVESMKSEREEPSVKKKKQKTKAIHNKSCLAWVCITNM